MTTKFLEINDEIYIVKQLTYYYTTQSYSIDTETLGTWEKVTFSCPSESPNFAFFDGLFKNPPPKKIVSMYYAIWIINTTLNEPNRNHSKPTWWQQDTLESRHSLQVNTTFPTRRTLYNYNFLDSGRKPFTSQIAGYWESTRDNPYSHNSPNRRVRQPLCNSKNFQDAG